LKCVCARLPACLTVYMRMCVRVCVLIKKTNDESLYGTKTTMAVVTTSFTIYLCLLSLFVNIRICIYLHQVRKARQKKNTAKWKKMLTDTLR
jgi:hypothetical protein